MSKYIKLSLCLFLAMPLVHAQEAEVPVEDSVPAMEQSSDPVATPTEKHEKRQARRTKRQDRRQGNRAKRHERRTTRRQERRK